MMTITKTCSLFPYSDNKEHIYESRTNNISDILDAILRKTTKLTERYASDVLYDLDELRKAVSQGIEYHKVFAFRECGVESIEMLDNRVKNCSIIHNAIQLWETHHIPEFNTIPFSPLTIFRRVRISQI